MAFSRQKQEREESPDSRTYGVPRSPALAGRAGDLGRKFERQLEQQ